MFRDAYAKAKHYTKPMVASAKTVDSGCKSGIACFVVINREGWILTAYHVLKALNAIRQNQLKTQSYYGAVASIRAEAANPEAAEQKMKALGSPPAPEDVQHCAFWWGCNEVKLVDAGGIEEIDLGIGRLEPFDPESVIEYPVLKNPTHRYEPGASLCRLGYPFYDVPIAWDPVHETFVSGEAVSFPLFPIEGILTRFVRNPAHQGKRPYPLIQLETSSPGLRGQSGGPIFDTLGRLWGIQTTTVHLPLGFQPEFKNTAKKRPHQFLNAGRGAHARTILGLLDEAGLKYQISDD